MKKVIKRDGREVKFSKQKIEKAILQAFSAVDGEITDYAVQKANNIANYISEINRPNDCIAIEEIQDLVENGLMSTKRKDVAKAYITYRERRNKMRGGLTDKTLQDLLAGSNEYWNTENSNKNAKTVTTQRDYIAGITSTDLSRRLLLPEDIVEAHDEGIIHFHDMDYFAQNGLTNCELVNLEDMLQNGTVINGVLIEKPHRFITAATIATQIILAVTSSTYGGCTVSLTHLAPFVRDSYNRYLKEAKAECEELDVDEQEKEKLAKKIAEKRTKQEVKDGVQTFNYQVNSMTNTNG